MTSPRPEQPVEALLDETSDAWTVVERAIWPDGPARGHGSGVYAAHKARVIAALAEAVRAGHPDSKGRRIGGRTGNGRYTRAAQWREMYVRIAERWAVLLDRLDLAEDATPDDVLDAARASVALDGAAIRRAIDEACSLTNPRLSEVEWDAVAARLTDPSR
jgi:hypothetical protein